MKELFKKYKDIVSYLFFGALTTAINVMTYWFCYDFWTISNVSSTVIAWVMAVTFAFITNKLFVFESKSRTPSIVLKEATYFALCRLGTGVIEVGMMYIFVDILAFNGTVMKLITNFIVIVLNYVFSRLIIFKK